MKCETCEAPWNARLGSEQGVPYGADAHPKLKLLDIRYMFRQACK